MEAKEDRLRTSSPASLLYNALKVILESEKLRPLLAANDQKAFDQATQACAAYDEALEP